MTEQTKPKTKADELRAQGYTVAPCPFCATPCVWGVGPSGSKIPLSTRITVYTIIKVRGQDHAARNELSFGSHYFDCPKKEQFKK